MPQHESFYVIRRALQDRGDVVVTVLHEVPADAEELGSFGDLGVAIDFPQQEVQRLVAEGIAALYVDPPDDLVGAG